MDIVSALSGFIDLPWWGYIIVTLVITHITIACITIYLHRHSAHRALDLHPIPSHFFRFWLWLTTGMVTKEWTAIHRKHHQNELSFRMIYAFHENFVLPLSHDEVVHGKKSLLSQMPGDYWQRFANLRLLYGYQYTTPGKPLLFMGGEFGQWTEWNHDGEIDWALLGFEKHDGLRRYIGDLNAAYRREPALHELDFDPAGFSWIHGADRW